MINANKIVYGIIYVICLFVISMILGFADTAEAKEIPDIRTAERFNMGYPLINIAYGSEYSFKNDGWVGFISRYGTGWRLMWDPRTGKPNLIEGKGIPFYAGKGNNLPGDRGELSLEYLHNKILDFLKSNSTLMKTESASIALNKNASHIFENGRYAVIQYDYFMENVPVEGARIYFRFNNGNLIQLGSTGISDNKIPVKPSVSSYQAEDAIIDAFSNNEYAVDEIFGTRLLVVPEISAGTSTYQPYLGAEGRGLDYRLVWEVTYRRGAAYKEYRGWVDALTGNILYYKNITDYGYVSGDVSMLPGTRVTKVFPRCSIDNNGSKTTYTWGYYNYTDIPSANATSTLGGYYFTVNDTCGAISLTTATSPGHLDFGSSIGTDCDTPPSGGTGNTYAARSAFWHANAVRSKTVMYLPGNEWLGETCLINTNVNGDTCNGFHSSSNNSINFYPSGTGCNNAAEVGSMIYHEWGHGLDDNDGGPGKSPNNEHATGEGYADFTAALMTKDPCIFREVAPGTHCNSCPADCSGYRYIAMRFDDDNNPGTPDVPVRPSNLLNDNGSDCDRYTNACSICPYTKPDPTCDTPDDYRGIMGYQGHCESYIDSGALWDMSQNLVAAHGDAGWIRADRIWHESRISAGSAYQITAGGECNTNATIDGCAASNWYTVLLGADDDNGNLLDGTPNGGRIWNAFNAHEIACGASPANYNVCTEPSTPTLYGAASDEQIGLSWTSSTNATNYRIFVNLHADLTSCNEGGWVPYMTIGTFNFYTLSNMMNGPGYGFAVQAINGSDDCVSGLSNCLYLWPFIGASPNLTGKKTSGWENVLVPSDSACNDNDCVRSATLSADPQSSTISFKVLNNTTVNAGAHKHRIYADDSAIFTDNRASHNANFSYAHLNSAITLKGGRHMLKLRLDADNELAESNETDNKWIAADAAIFEPYDLDSVTMTIRSAPPDRNPEGYDQYSCDGYRFSVVPGGSQGYWGAVGILPVLSDANYDVRLHDDYTGSSQGFGTNLKWSSSGTDGQVEIIGINRNMTSTPTWWAGVIQGENVSAASSYQVHKDVSQAYINVPGSGILGNIPLIGVVSVEELYVDTSDLGTLWRITVTPDGGDIGIALINEAAQYFRLSDAYPGTLVNNAGNDGAEFFDIEFLTSGFYGLLIFKPDNTQGSNSIDYIIDISIAPSNLRPYLHAGWTAQVVPRDSGGCDIGGCTVSATLPGWAGTSYVNSTSINDGPLPVNTPFQVRYLLDDIALEEVTFASLPVGNTALDSNNTLAGTVHGGRHTLGMFVDANNNYSERNETDNTFYRQYVWSPYLLIINTPYSTTAPPDRDSTGYVSFNCDGYEFVVEPDDGAAYWSVVGTLPVSSTADYMVRLFDDYTGSTAGFSTSVVTSNNSGTGGIEVVGVNRNATGEATWWAGVSQGTNTPGNSNYYIYQDTSSIGIIVPSGGTQRNIPVNGTVAIEEIVVDAGDVGISWRFSVWPQGGDIGIALIDGQVWGTFSLADAIPGTNVNSNGSGMTETFDITFPAAGYYGLIIYKPDSSQLANSITYSITIAMAPSNLRPVTRPGWTAPAVPRASGDCTQDNCAVSPILPGWSGDTYFNSATFNDGPNNVAIQFSVRYMLDGVAFKETPIPGILAGSTVFELNQSSGVFKGGRHTIAFIVDCWGHVTEYNESDNNNFNQFVWSPQVLANNSPVTISAPSDRDSPGYVFYNCDGFEFSVVPAGGQDYWGAVGMIPFFNWINFDLRLHNDYSGSVAGFANPIAASNTGANGTVEIVGVNRHNAAASTWWAGVIQGTNAPGNSNYAAHKNGSGSPVAVPSSGTTGNIIANGVVAIEEIDVQPSDLGTSWTFTVTPAGGDIGIALIDQSVQYFRLADAMPGTLVNAGGVNQAETFSITFATAGYYALLIYKPVSAQIANAISYTLDITGVPSGGVAETPDGSLVPGVPLTISKSGTTQLELNWGVSCDENPGETYYEIYRGTLASLSGGTYNHIPQLCDSGTDTSEKVSVDTSSYYYLIVPAEKTEEGGYGFQDPTGNPRPASTSPCLVQNRIACP